MNLRFWCGAAAFLSASGFFTASRAMTIHDFGRMNMDDEASFVTLLVQGSADTLKAEGKPEQAARVLAFFHQEGKFGGVFSLADHIKEVNALNNRNQINPNNRMAEYQVEDAMERTLKDQGIIVPAKKLLELSQNFRPMGPPRSPTEGM